MSGDEKKYDIDDILAEYGEAEEITDDGELAEEYPEETLEPVADGGDIGDVPEETEGNGSETEGSETETEENGSETEGNVTEKEGNGKEMTEIFPETREIFPEKEGNGETDVNDKWVTKFLRNTFPVKGDGVFEVIRKIIFLVAVIVFIGAGIMLASTLIQSRKAVSDQSEARNLIETTVGTYIDEYGNTVTIPPTESEIIEHNKHVAEFFKEINEDYIGYLEIDGCEIYEPVVKSSAEDEDYYLKHNLKGEANKAGTIFMDCRCTLSEEYTSPNIVLYGHNQEDGTMFGRLKYYKGDIDFYSKHPVIKFNPEFENGVYLIYAFFVTNALENQDSNGEVFHYHDYIETMNNEYTFNWYQREVQSRNQIISPVDVRFGDRLLCLSTCSNEFTESRFVVFARKLREGESVSDFDFSETRPNPDARDVDWKAILSGENTVSPDTEETIEETTHQKSLEKRNERTNTTPETETETTKKTTTTAAETTTVTESKTETTVTTVPETESESEPVTETGGSAGDGEGTGEEETGSTQ